MRPFFTMLFLLLPLLVFSQNESGLQLIMLKDGSMLRGTLRENAGEETFTVTLTDGTEIVFSQKQLLHVRPVRGNHLVLKDGRRILDKGRYTSIAFHTMSAKRGSESNDDLRWGVGSHFSTGYQFSPALALGGGIGLDVHQYFFVPVFVEISGNFVKKDYHASHSDARTSLWLDGEFQKIKRKRHFPLCYALQIGYNVPVHELFNGDNSPDLGGGALIYPSLGLQFPSRLGAAFRFDIGYKFQHFTKSYTPVWWTNYETRDAVTLKSFALRAGWLF